MNKQTPDDFDVVETVDPLVGDGAKELNSARVSGKATPEWRALLARPMTLLLPRNRERDAKQTEWKNSTPVPFRAWLAGGPDGGLTQHVERKAKGYFPIVFGTAAGSGYVRRTANGMKSVEMVGIDVDSGDDYIAALDRIEAAGLACIAYTSFRDGAATSKVKRDIVMRALNIEREPTTAELRSYLAPKLRPEVLATVEIDGQDHDEDGIQIVYRHAPLWKYRLLFPLAEPLTVSKLALSQRDQQVRYARLVRGLAHKLDLLADEACFDVSRVFYMPSRPPGGDFALDVIRGRGLTLADMPELEKGGAKNAFELAGAGAKVDDREIGGMPILKWAAKYAHRLRIGELLQAEAPDKVRNINGDIVVVECPFDEWHSNAGDPTDTGCHVQDGDGDTGFVWNCKHGCKDTHDRLDMLHKALSEGWFDESCLTPGAYVILSDEEMEEPDQATEPRKTQKPKGRSNSEIEPCHIKADYPDQLDYARRRIGEANAERPRLFQFGGAYATADAVRHRIRLIEDRDSLHYVLQDVTRWEKTEKDGDEYYQRLIAPPESVVRAIYKDHVFADTLPEILAVQSTPFFDAEGRLVAEDGYHSGAKVYLSKGDLVLPGVSREPTAAEVTEAKRLIVEEVLADFPLGGMDRAEIVGTLSAGSLNAHAVTHAVAMTLLPFCRDMIAGPTPGHVYTKPGPGTGASLLVDVLTTITGGSPAPAMTFPTRAEEVGKTLSAALAEGAPVILFDNIGQAIASSELASAMTGTKYQARILGKTQLVMVPVRTVWTFTANNIEASREILRRFVLIPLDAGVPDPEKRTPENGWRHPNLRQWVTYNRPALVWACLTLIQHWVARGMVRHKAASLASYEDWAGVMGGILAEAGFHGFLGGQTEERAKATDAIEDGLAQLVRLMSEYPDGTVFRPGGTRDFGGQKTVNVMDVLNGTERHGIKGEADEDPIQINGWGYSDFDGAYKTSGRIGRGMKALARKPYQIGKQVVTFAEAADSKAGTSVYRMNKTE